MKKDKEEFSILKELWFPLLFGFILILLMAGGYFLTAADLEGAKPETTTSTTNANVIVQPPKDFGKTVVVFLNDLKNGEKDDAYRLTSKAFQNSMPPEKFTQFLTDYPILTKFEQLDPGIPKIEGKTAFFSVVLHQGKNQFPLQFTLTQENEEWKILGFVINQMTKADPDFRELNALMSLVEVVNRFLITIHAGHVDLAYERETSTDFKQKTTPSAFKQYIHDHPIFGQQANLKVVDGHIEGERGFLKMTLTIDNKAFPLDFTLRKEQEAWKVDGLFFVPAEEEKQNP